MFSVVFLIGQNLTMMWNMCCDCVKPYNSDTQLVIVNLSLFLHTRKTPKMLGDIITYIKYIVYSGNLIMYFNTFSPFAYVSGAVKIQRAATATSHGCMQVVATFLYEI